MSRDLWTAFDEIAARTPDKTAILWTAADAPAGSAAADDGALSQYSYAELAESATRTATGLAELGVRPGDRVAAGLHNSPALVALMLGTFRLGATYVPMNPAYTGEEAAYIVSNADARVVIAHAALQEGLAAANPTLASRLSDVPSAAGAIAPATPSDAAAPALIVYTSGTTGRPKGAALSHQALSSNLGAITAAWEWTRDDCLLLTLPCSHLHGLALGLLGSLLRGSTIALRPRFVAEEVPPQLERHGCTAFFGVPTMYNRLVQLAPEMLRRHDMSRMRLWACGSAPLLPTTFERFRAAFGAVLVERFGMSEGGFMLAAPLRGERRAGVVGFPVPGVEVRIVEDEEIDRGVLRDVDDGAAGELLVRGDNLFSGYWNDAAATRAAFAAGWFRTGDLAAREADGQYRIAGRRSADILKVRGYKVSAVEIEDRLQSFPGVREVAVVGLPHPDWGQEIVAVVAAATDPAPRPEDLLAHAREVLASHKVPNRIIFVDEIPKVGPGKYRKNELVRKFGPAAT